MKDDDEPQGEKAQFLAQVRTHTLVFFDESIGTDQWEIYVEPDVDGGHLVTMRMNGLECHGFRLDE